jgi:hypothetical protein
VGPRAVLGFLEKEKTLWNLWSIVPRFLGRLGGGLVTVLTELSLVPFLTYVTTL